MSAFEKLNAINVNGHTEKKNGLTYLSWAWAWGELLKQYPDSTYTIYENKDGWCYHTDGRTAWVKTGVTVEGKEYIEMLPVMDFKNRSIPLEQITSFDVNKAIQRSLTKAVARHGLGLYIYAGEDLPDGEEPEQKPVQPAQNAPANRVVVTAKDAADAATEARIKCLKLLKETAAFAFGPEKADEAVDYYLGKWAQTRETMTGDVYKKVKEEITSIIAQNAKKEGAA